MRIWTHDLLSRKPTSKPHSWRAHIYQRLFNHLTKSSSNSNFITNSSEGLPDQVRSSFHFPSTSGIIQMWTMTPQMGAIHKLNQPNVPTQIYRTSQRHQNKIIKLSIFFQKTFNSLQTECRYNWHTRKLIMCDVKPCGVLLNLHADLDEWLYLYRWRYMSRVHGWVSNQTRCFIFRKWNMVSFIFQAIFSGLGSPVIWEEHQ